MCGITGYCDLRAKREPDRAMLRRMSDSLLHRGPDGSGEHFAPGVALGHRRLSIIDLETGQQPLYNEDRSVVVVFNGEIYNYQSLIPELQAIDEIRDPVLEPAAIEAEEDVGDQGALVRFRSGRIHAAALPLRHRP